MGRAQGQPSGCSPLQASSSQGFANTRLPGLACISAAGDRHRLGGSRCPDAELAALLWFNPWKNILTAECSHICRLRGFRGRHGLWNILFCALIVASLLIMLATSAWGLAAGISATRHLSDDFWNVIQVARTKVRARD